MDEVYGLSLVPLLREIRIYTSPEGLAPGPLADAYTDGTEVDGGEVWWIVPAAGDFIYSRFTGYSFN